MAGALAFVLVGGLVIIGLGSLRLTAATLITLLMGLVWTGGYATFAVGQLNLISMAFAVLFIGIGVDFGIQFCLNLSPEMEKSIRVMIIITGVKSSQIMGSELPKDLQKQVEMEDELGIEFLE